MDDVHRETSDDTLKLYEYTVRNISTGAVVAQPYCATATEAVIFAWARLHDDTNMFEWAEKYGPLVEQGRFGVYLGNIGCLRKEHDNGN